jgi:CelD/BcsL family acetyltransferase involved in cellulose biosynthesis
LRQLPIDDARWREFVRGRADATPFHDPSWASLLAECYRLRGFVLVETDQSGTITAGMPLLEPPRLPGRARRLVSLPFTDALEPLVAPPAARAFSQSAEAVRAELGVGRIELRGNLVGAAPGPVTAVTHLLPLTVDFDTVTKGFSHDKRRNAGVSRRKGLEVLRAESERDITETFFRLHLDTRRRLGVPSQPKRFFQLLWRRVIEPGSGFVLIVRQGHVPVASAVFLTGCGRVVYKYSASDLNYRGQKPNDLLIWSAIESACDAGFTSFDFGRSELSATGLRAFKSSWGAVETPLVYSTIGEGELGDLSPATEMLGRVLRHSPRWVARASGELLYRYAS